MAAEKRVNPQVTERDESEGEIGLLSEVLNGPKPSDTYTEIEVDPVVQTSEVAGVPMSTIRVNRPIEEMSFTAGGKSEHYTFEEGHQYQVPRYIALELESIGAVWH